MIRRVLAWTQLVVAVLLGAVGGVVVLVAVAWLATSRAVAALASVGTLLAITGWCAWSAVRRITEGSRLRVVLAGTVTAATLVIVGGAVWELVYAPVPPRPHPAPAHVKYWELPTGSRIAYLHTAAQQPAHPAPVILVHGGPGSAPRRSQPLARPLAAAGFEVYEYHQLGGGLSSRLDDPSEYTLSRHIADLDGIRAVLDSEQMILIGGSWGGQLIANYLATHPERVEWAVVASPGPIWAPAFKDDTRLTEDGLRDQQEVMIRHPRFVLAHLLYQVAGQRAAHTLFPDRQVDGAFADMVADLDMRPGCDPTSRTTEAASPDPPVEYGFWVNAATTRDTYQVPDPRPALEHVDAPVLVLRGECDYFASEITREYHDILPNAVFAIVPDAGHIIEEDHPELYERAVTAFLLNAPLPAGLHPEDK